MIVAYAERVYGVVSDPRTLPWASASVRSARGRQCGARLILIQASSAYAILNRARRILLNWNTTTAQPQRCPYALTS